MKAIANRLRRIEGKLGVGDTQDVLIIKVRAWGFDEQGRIVMRSPTEPVDQNPQYIQQMKKPPVDGHRIIVLTADRPDQSGEVGQ